MPTVKPEILVWARETAGLSVDDAAHKLAFRPTKKFSPAEKLQSIEASGEVSRTVLKRMVTVYRRPLIFFYLESPPAASERGQDFRTLYVDREPRSDALLDTLVRNIHTRQSIVRDALVDEGLAKTIQFIGSIDRTVDPEIAGERIIEALGFDRSVYRSQRDQADAFKYLRKVVEATGIFVVLTGDLGNHITKFEVSAFRGFALSDDLAPFIVINDNDATSAWSFTLLHELAHLWLGETGVSGQTAFAGAEVYCNDVASLILLPDEELQSRRFTRTTADAGLAELVAQIDSFASETKLSSQLIAYRLLKRDLLSQDAYTRLVETFRVRWTERRERARRGDAKQPIDFYTVRRHRIGPSLLEFSTRMLDSGTLSTSKVATVLGVRPLKVGRVIRREAKAQS